MAEFSSGPEAPELDEPKSSEAGPESLRVDRLESAERSALDGVSAELPALLMAQRTQEKASLVGFDWPSVEGPLAKVHEELAELEAAVASKQTGSIEAELGDVLFSMVNVARFLGVDAEDALFKTVARFSRRFRHVETRLAALGKSPAEADLETLERLWSEAKDLERAPVQGESS